MLTWCSMPSQCHRSPPLSVVAGRCKPFEYPSSKKSSEHSKGRSNNTTDKRGGRPTMGLSRCYYTVRHYEHTDYWKVSRPAPYHTLSFLSLYSLRRGISGPIRSWPSFRPSCCGLPAPSDRSVCSRGWPLGNVVKPSSTISGAHNICSLSVAGELSVYSTEFLGLLFFILALAPILCLLTWTLQTYKYVSNHTTAERSSEPLVVRNSPTRVASRVSVHILTLPALRSTYPPHRSA